MQAFLTAKNKTIRLMETQVDGLHHIKDVCVKKCNYDANVIHKMEELYRLVRNVVTWKITKGSFK